MFVSMTGNMDMKRNSKGFYTLEAVIFLPLVLLAVLSLGYFMKVEGAWENAFYGAVDESTQAARKAYDGVSGLTVKQNIKGRIADENPQLAAFKVSNFRCMYTDGFNDKITSYQLEASMELKLPLGFGRDFSWKANVKYRNFVGKRRSASAAGDELSQDKEEDPVWIFSNAGERYHTENCTYVKARAEKTILDSNVREHRDSCEICDSGSLKTGSIVYCFRDSDTCYHRGSCRAIKRHTSKVDREEAKKKGYTPCSKCGGG